MSQPAIMRPVYIVASGLVCARGDSPACVAAALQTGECATHWRHQGSRRWPWFALPFAAHDWLTRAERAVRQVGSDLGPLDPQTPLFIASSSFQIGLCESQPAPYGLPRANAAFSRQLAAWLQAAARPPSPQGSLGNHHDGLRYSFSNACISGFSALEAAFRLIAAGQIDEAVILGFELASASTLAGFAALELLSPTACRPFDRDRDGLVLGEAVAAVRLTITPTPWRIAALNTGLDASSITGPEPGGEPIARLIADGLNDAGLLASDIDLIKLQAAGSPLADLAEANALHTVFAQAMPPLLSLKSALGHTLGASGIAELAALITCLDAGFVPDSTGFATPDPAIGLQPTRSFLSHAIRHPLLNLIGFGGGLASLILERKA